MASDRSAAGGTRLPHRVGARDPLFAPVPFALGVARGSLDKIQAGLCSFVVAPFAEGKGVDTSGQLALLIMVSAKPTLVESLRRVAEALCTDPGLMAVHRWQLQRTVSGANAFVRVRDLYSDFEQWAAGAGVSPCTEKSFTARLRRLGFEHCNHSRSRRAGFRDLILKPTEPQAAA